MSDTFYRYFRVTKTTPNPIHDRRHKYGGKSIKEFKAGSFIRTYADDGSRYREVSIPGETGAISEQHLPPLEDWTVEDRPDDWRLYRGEFSNCDNYLLRELFRRGVVDYETAKEILEAEEDDA